MKEATLKKYSSMGLDKEGLYKLFCEECKTMPEIAGMFGISSSVVYALIHNYNIVRSKEQEDMYKEKMSKVYSACVKNESTQYKRRQAMKEHFGAEHWTQTDEGKKRLREIQLQPEVQDKIKATCQDRFGADSYFASKVFSNNREAVVAAKINTTRLKYGADYWSQSDAGKSYLKEHSAEHQAAVRKTNQERYGTDNPNQLDSVKNKIKETKISRYGVEYKTFFVDKIKQTKLERYNDENYNNIDKMRETKLLRYGDENYVNREALVKRWIQAQPDNFQPYYRDRDASIRFLKSGNYTAYDLVRNFGVTYATIYGWIKTLDLSQYVVSEKSHYESELRRAFGPLGFTKTNDRSVLDTKHELDLFSPEKRIGIEFNGDYWHSSYMKDKKYHLEKSLLAESKNIRLIHIYEYEWNDSRLRPIIESLIKIASGNVADRIYARNCTIKKITNNDAKEFNNMNHLQGHRNASVTYGLFYNDKLVQLMSFSKHPKYEWEIVRGCPGSNNIVVGGVSKLFHQFVEEYSPRTVFSYCDFNKFDGKGYEALGMKFIGYTGPDKTWLIDGVAVKRNPNRYKEYKERSEAIIWGAGSKKYLWTNPNN